MNENFTNLKKIRDPKFYLENFTKIKIKEGGLAPFILKDCQKDVFNTLKNNNRIMVLKSRQLGFSTAIAGYFYHQTITNPGVTTALIGYNSDLVSELLDKIKIFHKTTPVEIRPTLFINSKYEMSFPKLDSKILILPSTENVGSGYTINFCLLTELAKIEKAEEKMMSLMPAIPLSGKLVIESSPKGVGNLFHRMWMDDKNGFIKKRYDWRWGYTEEEAKQIQMGCSSDFWGQEYCCQFLVGGRSVFGQEVVNKVRNTVLEVGGINNTILERPFIVKEEEKWIVYRDPELECFYVVGVDTAEALSGGDYTVATILNRTTGEEVAMLRSRNIPPDIFGEILDKWGRKYNNALMVVESNAGISTIASLKKLMYPSMYFRPAKFETISFTYTDRIGWRTTGANRKMLIDDLEAALRKNEIIVHSKKTADEITVFIYDDNDNMKAQGDNHDDSVFSLAVANQGFKAMYNAPLTQLNYEKYMPRNFNY
jgi:hypothetical protein